MSERHTIRRYAHEMYPHAEEGETRALAVEVPYLYAQAVGLNVWGTGWYDDKTDAGRDRGILRHIQLIAARHMALVADALLQGMAGQEAWEWADLRAWDETGEWVYERAMHYGVPVERIKPYPCGPEPDRHDHMQPAPPTRLHARHACASKARPKPSSSSSRWASPDGKPSAS